MSTATARIRTIYWYKEFNNIILFDWNYNIRRYKGLEDCPNYVLRFMQNCKNIYTNENGAIVFDR